MMTMNQEEHPHPSERHKLEAAYRQEHPRLLARLRATGRSLEEAEDLIHDVYAETMARVSLISRIRNLPAWINALLKRRTIDAWRHDQVRQRAGHIDLGEETIQEIIAGAGLDPMEQFIRENLVDALNDSIAALPPAQRWVIEMQMFQGLTFRELAEMSGESMDTLSARKRYALANLSRALRHWIED